MAIPVKGGRKIRASQGDAPAQALALFMAQPSLAILLSTLCGVLGVAPRVGALAVYLLLFVSGLRAIPAVVHHAAPRGAIVAWTAVVLFASNILLHGGLTSTSTAIIPGFVVGLLWLVLACAVSSFELLRKYLYFVAVLILLAGGVELSVVSAASFDAGYEQSLGYLLLPGAIILADAAFQRRPVLNSGLTGIALFMLVSTGARGPLVAAIIFLTARTAWHMRKSTTSAMTAALVGVGAVITTQKYRDEMLMVLVGWLELGGLSTRSVERFMDSTLFVDDARDSLARHALKIIDTHPLFGIGIGNDYEYLAREMGAASSDARGWYPHNIVLEVLAQFGVIIGSLLLLLLIAIVVKAILDQGDSERVRVVLIFVAIGLVPLFVSGSYLDWPSFFALIGICLSAKSAHSSPSECSVQK